MSAARYPLGPVEALLFARYGPHHEFTVTVRRKTTVEQRVVPATDETGRWTLMALGRLLAPPPAYRVDDPKPIHHDVIRRWRESGLKDIEADEVAVRLGFHPLNIWPEYGAVEERPRPARKAQRALFPGHRYTRRHRQVAAPRGCAASPSESHQCPEQQMFEGINAGGTP